MNQKPPQRRGLGRGLGSLIPTGPRPDEGRSEESRPDEGRSEDRSPDARPEGAGRPAPASADWIGVPTQADAPREAAPDDRPDETTSASEPPGEDAPKQAAPAAEAPAVPEPAGEAGSEEHLAPVAGAYFAELAVTSIRPNPRQPRQVFDEEAMAELVHSVREIGLLQPVVVREDGSGGYELIMGERRWRATQEAGLDTIPAIVRETGDDVLLRDALLENLHRSQLNPLEEAAAYQQLLDDFGCTHEELASRIGRSRPQISNTMRLLKLSPAVQRRVAAGVLSAGHARALLGVEQPETQDRLAARVIAEGISVRGLEEIVAVGDLGSEPSTVVRRKAPTAPALADLAATLSDRLETRVKVDLGKRKGRITVEFASLPDLERIVGLIDPGHTGRTRPDSHADGQPDA